MQRSDNAHPKAAGQIVGPMSHIKGQASQDGAFGSLMHTSGLGPKGPLGKLMTRAQVIYTWCNAPGRPDAWHISP